MLFYKDHHLWGWTEQINVRLYFFQAQSRIYAYRNYLQQYLYTRRTNPPYYTTPKPSQKFEIPRQSNRRKRPKSKTTAKPVAVSPATKLAKIIKKAGGSCGVR